MTIFVEQKQRDMTYTQTQIENAKANYNAFLVLRSVESYQPEFIGWSQAEQRSEFHNNIVTSILNGNKEVEKEWKLFFLNEQVNSARKAAESKAKLTANKEASADILAPIKAAKKIGEFGKWLNTRENKYRSQHFSKKYTIEAINAFLETL
jgi:hypothetical protein